MTIDSGVPSGGPMVPLRIELVEDGELPSDGVDRFDGQRAHDRSAEGGDAAHRPHGAPRAER